jgi:hypothetical protein
LIFHPVRAIIPIYLAAIGPKNVALTAEIVGGWLPVMFSPKWMNLLRASPDKGDESDECRQKQAHQASTCRGKQHGEVGGGRHPI